MFVMQIPEIAPGGLDIPGECLGYGALISLLVSMLSRIGFIRKNPKAASAILSILWVAIPAFVRGGADFKVIAFCVLTQFGSSVAMYETVTKPIQKQVASQ